MQKIILKMLLEHFYWLLNTFLIFPSFEIIDNSFQHVLFVEKIIHSAFILWWNWIYLLWMMCDLNKVEYFILYWYYKLIFQPFNPVPPVQSFQLEKSLGILVCIMKAIFLIYFGWCIFFLFIGLLSDLFAVLVSNFGINILRLTKLYS